MANDNVISTYTTEQAIDDGVLIHPYPKEWKWLLITPNIHKCCEFDPTSKDSRTYDQKLKPLLMDCIMAAQAAGRKKPPLVLEHTVAGKVWIMPNEQGGMTVMTPEEY